MQYFLHGYMGTLSRHSGGVYTYVYIDASEFLRKYPWPGRAITDTFDDDTHRKRKWSKRVYSAMKIICGKTGAEEEPWDDEEREEERVLFDATENNSMPSEDFYWTPALQDDFRQELEKCVSYHGSAMIHVLNDTPQTRNSRLSNAQY